MNLKTTKNSTHMKDRYVADTMAVVLRLEKRKVSMQVKEIFASAEAGHVELFVPAMVLAEIGYLSEKKRIDTSLDAAMSYAEECDTISMEPITAQIVVRAFEISDIPELHDRIIAATAICRNALLITNDPVIAASKFIRTLW